MSALTKTIDLELLSSPGFPRETVPRLSDGEMLDQVLSNNKADDKECASCFASNPR